MSSNDRHPLIQLVENANAPAISAGRRGTCIRVSINDTAIAEVIECGFDRLLLERSSDSGLTYNEVTTPDQRVVLEKEQTSYTIVDRLGDPNFLYRTRYIETTGANKGDKSEPSESIAGAGLAIQGFLTVEELKQRYLFGIDTTDDAGNQLPDAVYEHYIAAAIATLEHALDIPIFPTSFCDFHDYYREDYHAFNFLKLDNRPLISVEEFRVQYPSGQTVIVFPQEWLRLNKPEGQVQIVPTAGTLSEILVGQGGSFLPAIYNGLAYLPQLFQLLYTSGFEQGKVPRNILDIIGKLASLGPFNLFGDLIAGAGIANLSLSLDGLSQSIGTTASATNAGYGARIIQYSKEIKEALPRLVRYYQGIRFVVA
jgi:hypothetical protein